MQFSTIFYGARSGDKVNIFVQLQLHVHSLIFRSSPSTHGTNETQGPDFQKHLKITLRFS